MKIRRLIVPSLNGITYISDVKPFAMKPGGSRGGFVGTYQDKLYLIKIESMGYMNTTAGKPPETAGIESFTAQFIRAVWGENHAIDIRVGKNSPAHPENELVYVKLPVDATRTDLDDFKRLKPINDSNFSAQTTHQYSVIVPYEKEAQHFTANHYNENNKQCVEDLIKMEAIVKLLGVSDHKNENIMVIDNHYKLIDCGALFPSELNLKDIFNNEYTIPGSSSFKISDHNVHHQIVNDMLQQFIDFPNDKLITLLDSYKTILSEETLSNIRNNIYSLQNDVKHQLAERKNTTPVDEADFLESMAQKFKEFKNKLNTFLVSKFDNESSMD